MRAAGRPVLVGTRTIENSEALSRHLAARNIPHQLLNARQDAGEAEIVAGAGVAGAVTIATNMAGRGTHISLDGEVLRRGGLHVIAFEMEESRRIDRQLTGRTARQGQPGSAQLFLSAGDHLLTAFAPQASDDIMKMNTSSTCDGEVIDCKRAVKWFQAAQAVAEKNAYLARRKLLHRDDWLSDTRERL